MSISQTTPEETAAGHLFCPQCNAALPQRATFCSSCGERLERKKQALVSDEEDINTRYRITTLVRRRPYINLYFALDNRQPLPVGQSRMVAIRDIEIANLKKEARAEIVALAQREYDQLRRWRFPHLLTCVDLRIFQGHLFLVSGMPPGSQDTSASSARSSSRLYTLQDFLQSGQGLPREARTLEWIRNLCQTVESLHRQQIILGDLDPYMVVLNKNSATAEPKLMISWLHADFQKLLPPKVAAPQVSYFSAPEAVQGNAGVRSDVYSLGALFYLLLTGTPPDESTLRSRRHLRTPREINSRLSQHVDDCVMQALALDPEERFTSATEMLVALANPQFRRTPRKTPEPPASTSDLPAGEAETVRIVPLSQKDVVRWRAAREESEDRDKTMTLSAQRAPVMDVPPPTLTPIPPAALGSVKSPKPARDKIKQLPITPPPEVETSAHTSALRPKKAAEGRKTTATPSSGAKQVWKDRITGILPAARPDKYKKESAPEATRKRVGKSRVVPPLPKPEGEGSLLKQLQRLILGQQQHAVEAAAIIETPMRVRPDQPYNLRMHVMGRDEPSIPPGSKKDAQPAGLSALVHGAPIQVEVRSVLQQGYTYVLQQAMVTIPANGYAAEITIPMQPQPGGAGGRRDRLYFFFLDGKRNPLYEKPFIVEVFVSPLVQFGREGHQVLTIPL